MLLEEVALASVAVAGTSSRLQKVALLAECLADATPDEVAIAVSYLSGELPQGTVGVGWAALKDRPPAAEEATLELLEVDAVVTELQAITGKGSQAARRELLARLFARAT
jgi:DNA ligase-1